MKWPRSDSIVCASSITTRLIRGFYIKEKKKNLAINIAAIKNTICFFEGADNNLTQIQNNYVHLCVGQDTENRWNKSIPQTVRWFHRGLQNIFSFLRSVRCTGEAANIDLSNRGCGESCKSRTLMTSQHQQGHNKQYSFL